MKTIRLIILAAFLLPVLTSHAQTKEETIAWLKEKLGNYLINIYEEDFFHRNLKLESINECEIVVTYEKRYIGESNYELCRETFPTIGCKINELGRFWFNSRVAKSTKETSSDVNFYNFVQEVKISDREDNIYQRIEKAIAHLATFCPKKQEAF